MLHSEDYTNSLEQEGRVETALIGLRYTGPKSAVPANQPRQQGGWPGRQAFQGGAAVETDEDGRVLERDPGPMQIGINPDWLDDTVEGGSLTGLEALQDFEVIYDPSDIAARLLEANFLPPAAFGSPADTSGDRVAPDYEIREAVFDHLGLEDQGAGPGSHEQYREQLAEIAGIDLDADAEAAVDDQRAQELVTQYSRSALKDAVDALRAGPDDIALNAKKLEFAEWLAQQDRQDVEAALAGEYEPDESAEPAEQPDEPADDQAEE